MFAKKNNWLESTKNGINVHKDKTAIFYMGLEAMKPIKLMESKKQAINYYVFESCGNTLVS